MKSFLLTILLCSSVFAQTPAAKTGAAKAAARPAAARPLPLNPALLKAKAPELFKAKFTTTKGDFVVEVHRDWAPLGADRFYNLVKSGFFTDVAIFRVLPGFMAQFGISGNPKVAAAWMNANIKDDPVKESNTRGKITYAMGGPNTRTTQVFINFGNNARLDSAGFSPFGNVIEGMEIVDQFYSGYGEGAPDGNGPAQGKVQSEGNAYLTKSFPLLDRIVTAKILPDAGAAAPARKK